MRVNTRDSLIPSGGVFIEQRQKIKNHATFLGIQRQSKLEGRCNMGCCHATDGSGFERQCSPLSRHVAPDNSGTTRAKTTKKETASQTLAPGEKLPLSDYFQCVKGKHRPEDIEACYAKAFFGQPSSHPQTTRQTGVRLWIQQTNDFVDVYVPPHLRGHSLIRP